MNILHYSIIAENKPLKRPKPNQPFIDFVLKGMFETIEYLLMKVTS
jgi:hypothetical protein